MCGCGWGERFGGENGPFCRGLQEEEDGEGDGGAPQEEDAFYTQAAEETSRGIEIFVGVTIVYALSAFVVNRIMAFVEKKIQIPGFVVAAGAGGGH